MYALQNFIERTTLINSPPSIISKPFSKSFRSLWLSGVAFKRSPTSNLYLGILWTIVKRWAWKPNPKPNPSWLDFPQVDLSVSFKNLSNEPLLFLSDSILAKAEEKFLTYKEYILRNGAIGTKMSPIRSVAGSQGRGEVEFEFGSGLGLEEESVGKFVGKVAWFSEFSVGEFEFELGFETISTFEIGLFPFLSLPMTLFPLFLPLNLSSNRLNNSVLRFKMSMKLEKISPRDFLESVGIELDSRE